MWVFLSVGVFMVFEVHMFGDTWVCGQCSTGRPDHELSPKGSGFKTLVPKVSVVTHG
jgi:hypothetical protein